MPKKAKTAEQVDDELPKTVTLRITRDDRDDFVELFRRCEAAGVDEISVYIKQLLNRFLHPDPSGEKAVRELLRDLREVAYSLQDRFEKLDSRTVKLRNLTATAVAVLLKEAAGWPREQAEKWVQQKLLG